MISFLIRIQHPTPTRRVNVEADGATLKLKYRDYLLLSLLTVFLKLSSIITPFKFVSRRSTRNYV
jgi:hypothetical protein